MNDSYGVKLITKIINAEKYFIGTEIAHVPSLYWKKARKGINQEAKLYIPTPSSLPTAA